MHIIQYSNKTELVLLIYSKFIDARCLTDNKQQTKFSEAK